MISLRTIIFFFLVLSGFSCYAQNSNKEDRLKALVKQNGQANISIFWPGKAAVRELPENLSLRSVKDGKLYLVITPRNIERFLSLGYDYEIYYPDLSGSIRSAATVKDAMQWDSYPTLPQYDSIMQSFGRDYPDLCSLDTIGTSIKGRVIYALRISGHAGDERSVPRVFLTSTMHGDETGGFILMLRLAEYLLMNGRTDPRVSNIIQNLEVWINPLANPDGTYKFGDEITTPVRDNANGVDLNRDFPDAETPKTIFQKETADMIKFLRKHDFTLSANFHSGAEVVNYPWDRWERHHADNEWFYQISRKYADTVHAYSRPGYMDDFNNGITNGYEWYSIRGGRQDFVTWELQGRELTIELDDDYITPVNELHDLWEFNRRSLIGFLENALYGIHGITLDSENGETVPAMIYINGHDRDSSQIYSDTLSGRFTRMLSPGLWNLTFSAGGYRDTTIQDVIVTDLGRTDIEVYMKREINPEDSTYGSVPVIYPNPSRSSVNVLLPSKMAGKVNIRIMSHSGIKIADFERHVAGNRPFVLETGSLSAGVYIVVFTNTATRLSLSGRFVKSGND